MLFAACQDVCWTSPSTPVKIIQTSNYMRQTSRSVPWLTPPNLIMHQIGGLRGSRRANAFESIIPYRGTKTAIVDSSELQDEERHIAYANNVGVLRTPSELQLARSITDARYKCVGLGQSAVDIAYFTDHINFKDVSDLTVSPFLKDLIDFRDIRDLNSDLCYRHIDECHQHIHIIMASIEQSGVLGQRKVGDFSIA